MTESAQRYRVVEKLESGGMAEVFRAESEGLQGFRKQVAIKRVLPHLSEKKRFIAMFLDEARISAQLTHSNCVQVFDIGVGDNAYFIVMEFVDGANLKSIAEGLKKQGKEFPVAAAAFVCNEICKGLAYAHELTDQQGMPLNIVHRDMSPPNVLVTKYGEVKIVDFGLAKASSQLEKSEPGIIKGKFSYLSPEAAMGQEVGPATDIFAVGIILWELLSGQRLFLGDTDFQTVKKVQQTVVPSISQVNRRVPPELERIVTKALARDVTARYPTAKELGQDLNRFLFSYGQAIGTFDIANIVQSTMRDRQRVRQPQGSIIDKLIEEALFEFTSLKQDGASQAGMKVSPAGSPLNAESFVDPTNWAEESRRAAACRERRLRRDARLAARRDLRAGEPLRCSRRSRRRRRGPVGITLMRRNRLAAPHRRRARVAAVDASSRPMSLRRRLLRARRRRSAAATTRTPRKAGATGWRSASSCSWSSPPPLARRGFPGLSRISRLESDAELPDRRAVGCSLRRRGARCPRGVVLAVHLEHERREGPVPVRHGVHHDRRVDARLLHRQVRGVDRRDQGKDEVAHSPTEPVTNLKVKAVSRAGVAPQGYISKNEAEAACQAAHKRLCTSTEWQAACRGRKPSTYPYGDEHKDGYCNDNGRAPVAQLHPEMSTDEVYASNVAMNDPRINKSPNSLAPTGEFSKCKNGYGVFDMVGNLHEWTAEVNGTHGVFRGGYYQDTHLNGEGCNYKTVAHDVSYHDYSTGFRCCADAH